MAEVLGAIVFCGVEVSEFVVTGGEAGEFVVGIVILTVSHMKLVSDLRERTLKRTTIGTGTNNYSSFLKSVASLSSLIPFLSSPLD